MKHRLTAVSLALLLILATVFGCAQTPSHSEKDHNDGDSDVIHSVITEPTTPSQSTTASTDASSNPTETPTNPTTTPTVSSSATAKPSTSTNTPTSADPGSCSHAFEEVDFTDSTCAKEGTKTSRCTKCGFTNTETIAMKTQHTGGKATCSALAVCTVCGKSYGDYASHSWSKATCQAPSTCRICGATTGSAKDHTPSSKTTDCSVAITCTFCNKTLRAATAHNWTNATCQSPAVCRTCGATTGTTTDHTPSSDSLNCGIAVTCTVCGETLRAVSHHTGSSYSSDCTVTITCTTCGETLREAREHDFRTKCDSNARCYYCDAVSDTIGPIGHNYSNGKCTRCSKTDPNYTPPSNAKVSFVSGTSYTTAYGKVESATYKISGSTLTITVTGRRGNDAYGNQSLKVKYKVYAGTYMTTLAEGSEYSAAVSANSSFSIIITLSGIITSSYNQYYIALS